MSRNLSRRFLVPGLLCIAVLGGVPYARAQAPDHARTATKKVKPAYPDLARNAHLEGRVRLSVVVTPKGGVKSVAVTGGHPIFAVAATDAAKQWEFAPAAKETTQVLVFDFKSPEK